MVDPSLHTSVVGCSANGEVVATTAAKERNFVKHTTPRPLHPTLYLHSPYPPPPHTHHPGTLYLARQIVIERKKWSLSSFSQSRRLLLRPLRTRTDRGGGGGMHA
jgi:hypothetical protein